MMWRGSFLLQVPKGEDSPGQACAWAPLGHFPEGLVSSDPQGQLLSPCQSLLPTSRCDPQLWSCGPVTIRVMGSGVRYTGVPFLIHSH